MPQKRYCPKEIIAKLREVEVLLGQGGPPPFFVPAAMVELIADSRNQSALTHYSGSGHLQRLQSESPLSFPVSLGHLSSVARRPLRPESPHFRQ